MVIFKKCDPFSYFFSFPEILGRGSTSQGFRDCRPVLIYQELGWHGESDGIREAITTEKSDETAKNSENPKFKELMTLGIIW